MPHLAAKQDMKKVLLIIPAYNEEENIKAIIQTLRQYPYDILVINDGSKDSTLDICHQLGAPVIDLPFNAGLANAFQTGIRYACKHSYDYAIQFDADGQHLPQYIGSLLSAAEENDIVIGSRFINAKPDLSPRQFGAEIIRLSVKLVTGQRLSDPTSGMRLYSRKMIELFASSSNFSPEPDTLVYLIRNGYSVHEVPVEMQERQGGKSYLNAWSSAKYMLRMILSILLIQNIRPKLKKEVSIT